MNLAVLLRRSGDPEPLYAVVQVPGVLPRFVQLPSVADPKAPAFAFCPLEDVIRVALSDLFPGIA